jgi:hypothetical protein
VANLLFVETFVLENNDEYFFGSMQNKKSRVMFRGTPGFVKKRMD